MSINKEMFYAKIRTLFKGTISQSQVEGMEAIINAYIDSNNVSVPKLAYILATVFHETARTMQPIEEFGKGNGKDYGRKLKMTKVLGRRLAYQFPDQLYYGRGFVQLTWFENYEKLGKKLGIDLLNNPELALDLTIASKILIVGMMEGLFTGKKLDDYINDRIIDFMLARKIINGMDKAQLIEEYANSFYFALK